METRKPQSRSVDDRSFSNGNASPDDGPQMEGWVLRPVHWWLWA
jgi:hypothetical protein